nr:hypothetical protein [uncultured Campylobacter sp.]
MTTMAAKFTTETQIYTAQRLNLRKFDDNGSQIYDRNSNFAAPF